ncbi:YncE family protein [Mycolicibacterium mengxianglii]|uniref:YncE family protein n=1 Tax=Mycolicibacterium mengxianglii TaxID=2736649 RepID=UPI0018EECFE9
MPLRVNPAAVGVLILTVLALVGVSCSSKPTDAPPPTIEPARAAISPAVAEPPAGTVQPFTGRPTAAVFDATVDALVVLSPGADPAAASTLTLIGTGSTPPRTITVPGPATALTTHDGTAYLSGHGGYVRVDLAAGTADRIEVADARDTEFTAVARRQDGGLALGSADGAVYLLGASNEVEHRVGIFARVDALTTVGDTTVVLDRGQTSVTSVDADGRTQQALRAGEGATTMVADPAGRVLVADTRGDELLVFGVDPLIMRQRYPVPAAPYGLTGSPELAWVSQTATNVVVGYDLATGIPVEKVRYPTVQQPDILAFDDATGVLFVVSGTGAGVQMIESAGAP